ARQYLRMGSRLTWKQAAQPCVRLQACRPSATRTLRFASVAALPSSILVAARSKLHQVENSISRAACSRFLILIPNLRRHGQVFAWMEPYRPPLCCLQAKACETALVSRLIRHRAEARSQLRLPSNWRSVDRYQRMLRLMRSLLIS